MRALATIAAVLLAGACLSSCDMPAGNQQQASTAPAPCNCTPPPVAAAAPPEQLTRLAYAPAQHHYRHHHGDREHGGYAADHSQDSVDAYDYVSPSTVSRGEDSYSESGDRGGRIVWVDGYGRGYFTNGPVTVAQTMRGRRLDPWHGYGADCPDDGEGR